MKPFREIYHQLVVASKENVIFFIGNLGVTCANTHAKTNVSETLSVLPDQRGKEQTSLQLQPTYFDLVISCYRWE